MAYVFVFGKSLETMKKKGLFFGGLIGLTLLTGWFALPYQPAYQERVSKDRSLSELQSLQSRLPENPISLYYLGVRFQEAHQNEEALTALKRAAILDPDNARIVNALATVQMSTGQVHETYESLLKFGQIHPENVESVLMLVRFFLTTKTYGTAIDFLRKATLKFPQNAECQSLLAIAYRESFDTGNAEKAAREATRLEPNQSKYHYLLAQILKDIKPMEARPSYERALQLTPNDPRIQADFADYLARTGDFSGAEKMGATGVVLAPRRSAGERCAGVGADRAGRSRCPAVITQRVAKRWQ